MNTQHFTGNEKVNRGGTGMCRMLIMRLILCISLLLPLTAGTAVSAAADPASITLDGYLLTSCCFFGRTGSPASHSRGCLKMPTCAHTGYGIAVLNNQGEYDFYFFDGTFYPAAAGDPSATGGQALARSVAETSVKANHIAIQVTGTLTGATRIQTHHDGTSGDSFAEINVTDIQEESAIAPVPADLTGYIIDEDCFTGNTNPGADSIMCLRMAGCAASGYGIAVFQADGTYSFVYFDGTFSTTAGVSSTGGQLLSANLLAGTLTENHVTIHVTGQYSGEKIKNTAGTNNNTLYPVFTISAISEVITPAVTPTAAPTEIPAAAPSPDPTTVPVTPVPTEGQAAAPTVASTVTPTQAAAVAGAALTPTVSPAVTPTPKPAATAAATTKTGEKDAQIMKIAAAFLIVLSAATFVFVINRRRHTVK